MRGIALGARFEPRPTTSLEERTKDAVRALLAWNAKRRRINGKRLERASLQCDATGRRLTIAGPSGDDDPGRCGTCADCVRKTELDYEIYREKKTLSRLRQEMQKTADRVHASMMHRREEPFWDEPF